MGPSTFGTGAAVEGITVPKGVGGGCSDTKSIFLRLLVSFRKPPPSSHCPLPGQHSNHSLIGL